MVSDERQIKKGMGVAILIRNKLRYKIQDLSTFHESVFENVIIEVEHSKKLTIVCSLYRSPNSSETEFNHYYKQLLDKLILETNKTILIGMDHNLDLLKSHIHMQNQTFLENTLNANLFPTMMRPTRITKSSATLIDNIYISNQLNYTIDSCILLSNILDHMPMLTIIWQNKSKKICPVEFKTCNLNENRTKQLVAELEKLNWSDRLQFNVPESASDKDNKFNSIIENSIDTVAPEHTVCISTKIGMLNHGSLKD